MGRFFAFVLTLFVILSCSEKIDESNMYVFHGQCTSQYIESNPSLSMFKHVLDKSQLSGDSKSSLFATLSARGNFTVFAPTNEAITLYLDSVYGSTEWKIDTMSAPVANQIAQNCIIDHGDFPGLTTSDFPNFGAIEEATINDRHIMLSYGVDENGLRKVILNKSVSIVKPDIEVSNGFVHIVDKVISPSSESLSALIAMTGNLRIFSYILTQTSWGDSIKRYRDETYEKYTAEEKQNNSYYRYEVPPHRYYGYMAFVEPDEVFFKEWNIPIPQMQGAIMTNEAEVRAAIEAKCKEAYPKAISEDWHSMNNPVNQFVSYHLVPFRESYNQLIRHMNEVGYNTSISRVLPLDMWTFFHSMGRPNRLFKITQLRNGQYRINRHSYYDVSFDGDRREVEVYQEGININESNGEYDNNALNGYYYTIDHMMVYSDYTRDHVLNERIRYDITQSLGELMSNDIRTNTVKRRNYTIPSRPYRYCDNLFNEKAEVGYVAEVNGSSTNSMCAVEGDLLYMAGFDFTVKLMHVPYAGTWEVRFSVINNESASLAQVYFGTNPKNLIPMGLPFDLRINGSHPSIGAIGDDIFGYDSTMCIENDKFVRNHEYMKQTRLYSQVKMGSTALLNQSLRNHTNSLRLIVYRGYMDPEQSYYVRFKTMLKDPSKHMIGDLIEISPKHLWGDPIHPENVW